MFVLVLAKRKSYEKTNKKVMGSRWVKYGYYSGKFALYYLTRTLLF